MASRSGFRVKLTAGARRTVLGVAGGRDEGALAMKRLRALHKSHITHTPYHYLLILLVAFLLGYPFFVGSTIGREALSGFILAVLVLGVFSATRTKLLRVIAVALAAPAYLLLILYFASGDESLFYLSGCGVLLALVFTVGNVLAYVLHRGPVTEDRIAAAVCGYLLIGILWAAFYAFIDVTTPDAFVAIVGERKGHYYEFVYFSFTTLTTTGYGDIAPASFHARAAYDMVVQGMGGIMSLTGPEGGPPVRVGASIGDLAAGLYLAVGLNAALYRREKSGQGCKLDIAMLDCQVALLEDAIVRCHQSGHAPVPHGTRHGSIAPFQTYRASDRPMVIAAANDRLFARMAQALGRPEWAQDPRFLTNALRHRNVDALEAEIESAVADATAAHWIAVLTEAGVPCGPVNDVAAMMKEPQVAARNMIVTVDDPMAGSIPVAGNPIKVVGLA